MHLWSVAVGSLSTGSLVEKLDSMFGILVCLSLVLDYFRTFCSQLRLRVFPWSSYCRGEPIIANYKWFAQTAFGPSPFFRDRSTERIYDFPGTILCC